MSVNYNLLEGRGTQGYKLNRRLIVSMDEADPKRSEYSGCLLKGNAEYPIVDIT